MAQTESIHTVARIENLHVLSAGNHVTEPTFTHTHASVKNITHALILITAGEGVLVVDGQKFALQKNSFFLIHAESETTFSSNPEHPLVYFSILFECAHVENQIMLTRKHPHVLLKDSKTERRMRALHKCLEVQTKRSVFRSISYFYAILASVSESKVLTKPEKRKNVIRDAIEYINSNYMNNEMNINNIAEKFYLNRSYFSELFKKETGVTAVNYISEIRLQKGLELLSKTDLSISQISDEIGMNYVWFSKLFKERFGVSPMKFRADLNK